MLPSAGWEEILGRTSRGGPKEEVDGGSEEPNVVIGVGRD